MRVLFIIICLAPLVFVDNYAFAKGNANIGISIPVDIYYEYSRTFRDSNYALKTKKGSILTNQQISGFGLNISEPYGWSLGIEKSIGQGNSSIVVPNQKLKIDTTIVSAGLHLRNKQTSKTFIGFSFGIGKTDFITTDTPESKAVLQENSIDSAELEDIRVTSVSIQAGYTIIGTIGVFISYYTFRSEEVAVKTVKNGVARSTWIDNGKIEVSVFSLGINSHF